MRKSLCLLAVASLGLAPLAAVHANEDCPCENGYYEKTVTVMQRVCRDVQVPTTVKKCFYREEMKPANRMVLVPKEVCIKKPKEVQVPVQVDKCRKIPVKLVDPETGCSIISYKTEYYKACQMKTEIVMVDAKVIRMVPEEQCVMERVRVPEWRDVTVMVTKQECQMVPCQKTIRCPCPPPGPNYRVVVPLDRRALPIRPTEPTGEEIDR